jgi:hypothetical protein
MKMTDGSAYIALAPDQIVISAPSDRNRSGTPPTLRSGPEDQVLLEESQRGTETEAAARLRPRWRKQPAPTGRDH